MSDGHSGWWILLGGQFHAIFLFLIGALSQTSQRLGALLRAAKWTLSGMLRR